MSSKELLFNLYQRFLERKEVLSEAPRLTLNPPRAEEIDVFVAENEMALMISYLMGVKDVRHLDFKEALDTVQKYYEDQPDWKELILGYFEYVAAKEEENLGKMEEEACQEIKRMSQEILEKGHKWDAFAENRIAELTQKNFPIDCRLLVFNYIQEFENDPTKAKEILSKNPLSLTSAPSDLSEEEKNNLNEQLKQFVATLKWDI